MGNPFEGMKVHELTLTRANVTWLESSCCASWDDIQSILQSYQEGTKQQATVDRQNQAVENRRSILIQWLYCIIQYTTLQVYRETPCECMCACLVVLYKVQSTWIVAMHFMIRHAEECRQHATHSPKSPIHVCPFVYRPACLFAPQCRQTGSFRLTPCPRLGLRTGPREQAVAARPARWEQCQ